MFSRRSNSDGSTPFVRQQIIRPLMMMCENFLKVVSLGVMAAAHNLDHPLPRTFDSKNMSLKSIVFAELIV